VNGSPSLEGRVCVVTGATSGIGRETALELARRGATVVAHARNRERGEALVREAAEHGGSAPVELVLADLASQAQVRRMAEEILSRQSVLHVLVNNAGIIASKRELTEDGVEQTMAVNHLAPFLLTHLLLDAVKRGGTPERHARVVTVASDAHRSGRPELADLSYAQKFSALRAYADSKLANVFFAYELQRRVAGQYVDSFAVHPGAVRSGWGVSAGGAFGLIMRLIGPFLLSSERGARPVIRAAADPALEGMGGAYVTQKGIVRSTTTSYDETAAKRLWELSERLTGIA
jgi:NAD(P)-dependent dehydrogenase (short-subunit alcohol dehydrogenase family)